MRFRSVSTSMGSADVLLRVMQINAEQGRTISLTRSDGLSEFAIVSTKGLDCRKMSVTDEQLTGPLSKLIRAQIAWVCGNGPKPSSAGARETEGVW